MNDLYFVLGIFSLIFIIIGAVFVMIGLIRSRSAKHWKITEGKIIKKNLEIVISLHKIINRKKLQENNPDEKPTFTYVIDGKEFTKTSTIGQKPGFKPGTIVEVLYNPDEPKQSMINSIVQKGTVFTIIGSIFLVLATLIILTGFFVMLQSS